MKAIFAWVFSYLPVFIAALLLFGALVLFSGCYTIRQGTTLLGYLGRATPLEKMAQGDDVPEEDRLFVRRVEDIRLFAIEELGLKESKNYTRYVELDRDYLAAVVSACAKDSFTRYEWWFPVVGRMPYKGFFKTEDARKERVKLEKKDLDVWIRGVDAFSTLGWFKDPLYSYMKNYSDRDLSELIIHELLHATVFLKNHTQFNEELAEFVGSEGARLYMEKIGGGKKYINSDDSPDDEPSDDSEADYSKADSAAYLAFIRALISELDDMYKTNIPRDEKLKRKEEIIANAKIRFELNYETLFRTDNYRGFIELPVNNAYLELYRLYYEENHYFKDLYEESGSNLPKFIAAAKTLNTRSKGNPKDDLEKALLIP